MLISGVLGRTGIKWITPLSRIAEIIAVAFAAIAGVVIIMDMGRPDRLANVFIYGRFQSPILWDVTVVTTYFVLSALLYFIPMIPDLAWIHKRTSHLPVWLSRTYKVLSLNWTDTPKKNSIINRCVRILLILIIPSALAIHTVTSWLFAMTSRAGWDSTLFGPYFVTGAFVSGGSAVIIAMYFFQKNYNLHNYITNKHFSNMGKLLVLVMLVYLYVNINEFLVPAYKLKTAEAVNLHDLFAGSILHVLDRADRWSHPSHHLASVPQDEGPAPTSPGLHRRIHRRLVQAVHHCDPGPGASLPAIQYVPYNIKSIHPR